MPGELPESIDGWHIRGIEFLVNTLPLLVRYLAGYDEALTLLEQANPACAGSRSPANALFARS